MKHHQHSSYKPTSYSATIIVAFSFLLIFPAIMYISLPLLTKDVYDVGVTSQSVAAIDDVHDDLIRAQRAIADIATTSTSTDGLASNSNDASTSPRVTRTYPQFPRYPRQVTHISTPTSGVKGFYMSACAASSPDFRYRLTKLFDTTELNAVILDIKDFSGELSFTPDDADLLPYVSGRCYSPDMAEFIQSLHEKGVYVIGRVTTFQDPLFTARNPASAIVRKDTGDLWRDKHDISYIDPASEIAWKHLQKIAEAAHRTGFDEINFDYIRYPSDGTLSNARFAVTNGRPKPEVLESFFQFLNTNVRSQGIIISADLFGMTTTATDDLGIGQELERALPYFDYIMPMVYPSHYPATFNGWQNPNAVPYELITFVMGRAVERAEAIDESRQKLRTWIQDFTLGVPYYSADKVKDQIRATTDLGLNSWILWNAANNYSVDALNPKQ